MSSQTIQRPRRLLLDQPFETLLMRRTHDAVLRDLTDLLALTRSGKDSGSDLGSDGRACWQRTNAFMAAQLTAERTPLWPIVRHRAPGHEAMLDYLDGQRTGLTARADALEAALMKDAPPHQVGVHASRLAGAYAAYSIRGESLVLPLALTRLRRSDWAEYGHVHLRLAQVADGFAAFYPWLLEDAPADLSDRILSELPRPTRWLHRTVWRPRHDRRPTFRTLH